ncbi:translocon-associated protein subunit alpha [Cinnamomum micranthum f. kanehirae]|uniref:Translocon-associated protein subunit alpha n=1 Tax=Cinnamomum micranthum f. kanehirae TaxID=337451 RepID=A0A3S4NU86_9MAGN|nr:translocon-associated protein subunit alpha [Cinnamomum micranthum f. kanehirae]
MLKVNDVSNSAFLLPVKTKSPNSVASLLLLLNLNPQTHAPRALVRSSSSFISSMAIRVFFLLLLLTSPFLFQVVRCQSDDVEVAEVVEGGDLGIVGDGVQDFGDGSFAPAAGVDTVCVFPKNAARLVTAGKETELLVGLMNNEGESPLNVLAIRASLHLPFAHHLYVQNLTVQEFYNASVPFSAQAAFPYIFTVNKYLQSGSFDLVGTIVYEIDQHPYQSIFYNGTIEVVEAGGFLSIESVFLFTLGIALVGLLFSWIYGQIQNLSKKTKRAPKVEVGTGTTDASLDEWLQGTAYAQSLSSNKSKKKK